MTATAAGSDTPASLAADNHHVDVSTARRRIKAGQIIATVLVGFVALWLVTSLATNQNIQWGSVAYYFRYTTILQGVGMTIVLTAIAMALGILGGAVLALGVQSSNKLVKGLAWSFVWFFRGTPALVQIIFWYNIAIFAPRIEIGVPFIGPIFVSWDTNLVVTAFVAALLALSLHESAYMCEIIRAGFLSVPNGQLEAAKSLGMPQRKITTQIVFRQAMRTIIPPTGNQVIGLLKGSSLVSVIAVGELLYSAESIYNVNGKMIPLLVVATLWYLILTTLLYIGQHFIERHYNRGYERRTPKISTRKDSR